MDSPQVLIVGGGPVGLALSIELGMRGITCLVIEQNDRVGLNPRAKTTNVRTREHLRRWGIADALRLASPVPPDFPPNIVFATRLNSYPLARFENAFNGVRERNNLYSEEAQWVPQYILEEVLRAHAASLPTVRIRFGARMLGAEQDDGGIVASVEDLASGETIAVRAAYLVGCDGARSRTRELIGARMEGQAAFSRNYSIQFRAPTLASMHTLGPAIQYWLVNDEAPSLMGPMDDEGLWFAMFTKLADGVEPDKVDPKDLIRRATGLDFEMEIVGTDPWVAHKLIADKYGDRCIFLAGDACHLHPPFGGFGLNMGVGDAVDLGWKLAATLQGWGGPALLDSYSIERRPVHERVMDEAAANYAAVGNQLVQPDLESAGPVGEAVRREVGEVIRATKVREFKTLGVVLGYRYRDSPVIVPDGSAPPAEHVTIYAPSAHPGCLAPHLWLADGSSLYDHFGPGFTLLVTSPDDLAHARGLSIAATDAGLPLKVIAPPDDRLHWRYRARYALIRPDQHVAWRGDAVPEDAKSLLEIVRGAR
jgi:2-polyprenyl-6-methoxyphenol hydroxylase-like FAD-dependent oxidoreductase